MQLPWPHRPSVSSHGRGRKNRRRRSPAPTPASPYVSSRRRTAGGSSPHRWSSPTPAELSWIRCRRGSPVPPAAGRALPQPPMVGLAREGAGLDGCPPARPPDPEVELAHWGGISLGLSSHVGDESHRSTRTEDGEVTPAAVHGNLGALSASAAVAASPVLEEVRRGVGEGARREHGRRRVTLPKFPISGRE